MNNKHEIISVEPGGIADEIGITPGDFLLSVGGAAIGDVIDYRFKISEENIVLEIEKPDGEVWETEIEKDAGEDLGINFKRPFMSAKKRCENACIFCFVDQQPTGLRPSLYIKDDDPRLSFLTGNYVTLTNLSPAEVKRICDYRLSPVRISVHAADMSLRKKMMGTERAGDLLGVLEQFGNAGITMHFQAVVCKGINDGGNLDYTIMKLSGLKGAASLAIVPAGLTRHRDGLFHIEPFSSENAAAVIRQISRKQKKFLRETGTAFVFPADEWYIMAGRDLPAYGSYEDFPQLDNGVGMIRLFERDFLRELRRVSAILRRREAPSGRQKRISIVTGTAAERFMEGLAARFTAEHPWADIKVFGIKNDFFGHNVNVSGLLTGQDIIAGLIGKVNEGVMYIPENAFRRGSKVMLDGTTRKDISKALGITAKKGSSSGKRFCCQLIRECDEYVTFLRQPTN